MEEIVDGEEGKRKNIRENRMNKLQDIAQTDHDYQKMSIELMHEFSAYCKESTAFKREVLDVMKGMASSMEKSNAYYVL